MSSDLPELVLDLLHKHFLVPLLLDDSHSPPTWDSRGCQARSEPDPLPLTLRTRDPGVSDTDAFVVVCLWSDVFLTFTSNNQSLPELGTVIPSETPPLMFLSPVPNRLSSGGATLLVCPQ